MAQQDRPYVEQVGGDHYGTKYGHWDFCKDADISYLPGCATKYIYRWKKKAGIQDLEKALSFVDKMLAGLEPNADRTHGLEQHYGEMERWFAENDVPANERILCYEILAWETYEDLRRVRKQLAEFIRDQKALAEIRAARAAKEVANAEEANSNYTNQG